MPTAGRRSLRRVRRVRRPRLSRTKRFESVDLRTLESLECFEWGCGVGVVDGLKKMRKMNVWGLIESYDSGQLEVWNQIRFAVIKPEHWQRRFKIFFGSVEFDRMICLKFLVGMYQNELVSVGFPNLGTHLNHPSLEARCDIRCEAKESVPLSDSSNRSWPRHADLSIFFIISIA